jgi:PAP2 superfamily
MKEEMKLEGKDERSGLSAPVGRRAFLSSAVRTTGLAAGAVGLSTALKPQSAEAEDTWRDSDERRREQAFLVRLRTASAERRVPLPLHPTNGDEERYATKIGNYSKALPHNGLGEVDATAYGLLIDALTGGKSTDFAAIPLGGTVKLQNPQASYAYLLEGADSHATGTIAPPAFATDQQGGEMDEDYWMALTRDVPFSRYGSEPLTAAAITDLDRFPNYAGVNAESLFRASEIAGTLIGPYVSQFLWLNVPYGATTIVQQYKVPLPGASNDFNTVYSDWINCQNGVKPTVSISYDTQARYIRNGRDVGEWVHKDWPYMGSMDALLIILGLNAPADAGNPYNTSANQAGFVTFGTPYYTDLVARVCEDGMKAAWFQKWLVHRRMRPEAFAGTVHNTMTGAAKYHISPLLLNSQAVKGVFSTYGSYLLPQAYAEGCPAHPSYPAAHAVIAGACVTVLKALFEETFVIPNPVVASDDGRSLVPYSGATLTLGNELNKLAANIAFARDMAGVHWHSDGIQGMLLGEAVAISVLSDYRSAYNERFSGFSLTKFDGTTITV